MARKREISTEQQILLESMQAAGNTQAGEALAIESGMVINKPIHLNDFTKWDSVTTYASGAFIAYGDAIYISLVNNNLNHIPSSLGIYWKYLPSSEIGYNNGGTSLASTNVNSAITEVSTKVDNIINPLQYKGIISVATDFPTISLVKTGWYYHINADVIDNNATKTNTGQSFLLGDEIVWNGTNWDTLGSTSLWKKTGSDLSPVTSGDNTNLGTGGLKDANVTTPVKLGNVSNTSFATVDKTIIGSVNEVKNSLDKLYAGPVTTPILTDNGNGTGTVNTITAHVFDNPNGTGIPLAYTVTGGTFTFTDGAEEYIVVDYNGGTPIMRKETDKTLINDYSIFFILFVWRQGTVLHNRDEDSYALALPNKINASIVSTTPYRRSVDGGLILGETTTPNPRTMTCSSGVVFAGIVPEIVNPFNSSTDKMTECRNTNGVFTYSDVSVYDNMNLNPTTGVIAMSNNKFSCRYFYRSIGDAKQLFYIMGTIEYNSIAAAESDKVPAIPILLRDHCMLVGRAIIQKSATSGITESAFDTTFAGSNVINHNDTLNIQGGTSGNYYHNPVDLQSLTKEPTGFDVPENVIVTGNSTNRTITLTGTFNAYWRGILNTTIVTGYVSPAHGTDTAQKYYLSYDGNTISWSTSIWTFDKLQIAIARYDSVAATWVYIRETHGFMAWQDHQEAHETIGTYKQSGGTLSSYVLNSTTAADRRLDISQTVVKDEDLLTIDAALTSKLYTQFRLGTAGADVFTVDAADIVSLSTNNPYYNSFSSPNWGQTLFPANSVGTIWVYATPVASDTTSQKYRFLFVQPQWITQAANSSAGNLLAALNTELTRQTSELNLGGLNAQENICIGRIAITYTGGNWILTNVSAVNGTRLSQVSAPAGNYLSAVSTDSSLTGNGTSASPLSKVNISDITYANLVSAISGSTLIKGQQYRLTDFNSIYINNANELSTTVSPAPNEVLILTAISSNQIEQQVFSESFPQDIIYYDYSLTYLDGTNLAKGFITYRKDTIRNIEAYHDWRNVKYKRWPVVLPGVTTPCAAWAAITAYAKGAKVYSGTSIYQCWYAHTSGGAFDASNWIKLMDTASDKILSTTTPFGGDAGTATYHKLFSLLDGTDMSTNWVKDISIKPKHYVPGAAASYSQTFNNITIIKSNTTQPTQVGIYELYFAENCYNMIFKVAILGKQAATSTFSHGCNNMFFGTGFYGNNFGNNCSSMYMYAGSSIENKIGDEWNITADASFAWNNFDNMAATSTIICGSNFKGNRILNSNIISGLVIGHTVQYNTFINMASSNSGAIRSNCSYNTFSNRINGIIGDTTIYCNIDTTNNGLSIQEYPSNIKGLNIIRNQWYSKYFSDFIEDFITYGQIKLLSTAISGGVSNASSGGLPGVVSMSASSNANSGYNYSSSLINRTTGQFFDIIFSFNTTTLTFSYMGLHNSITATAPTNGMYFSTNGTTLSGKCTASSSTTTTASTYTITAGTWYRGRIYFTGTSVVFYLYDITGALLWSDTVSTNISANDVSISVTVCNSGTGALNLMSLDYVQYGVATDYYIR